jgi:ribose transport system permease protein
MSDGVALTQGRSERLLSLAGRYGVLAVFLATVVTFSALRPDEFLRAANLQVILIEAAPLAVIGAGLTIVLVMNDFDLSFAAVAGLAAAIAFTLMSQEGAPWTVAVLAALAAGCAVGMVNGGFIALAGGPSFIVTLAMGTGVTGVEFLIADKATIFSGVSPSYISIGQGTLLGIDVPIVIAAVVLGLVYVLLEQTEIGRRMYAVGGSAEAARLAGVRVNWLRFSGFVIVGIAAATVGIMTSASAATYTPSAQVGLLLPAFAAVFLGSTVLRSGTFNIFGTLIGVLFLGVIQNGLILLGIADAWVNVVQCGILIFSVMLARVGVRGA